MHKRVSDRFAPSPLNAMTIQPSVNVKELGLGNIAAPSRASAIRRCVFYTSHGDPLNFVLCTRTARAWTEEWSIYWLQSQPDTSFSVSVNCLAENQIKLITGN